MNKTIFNIYLKPMNNFLKQHIGHIGQVFHEIAYNAIVGFSKKYNKKNINFWLLFTKLYISTMYFKKYIVFISKLLYSIKNKK